MYEGLKDLLSLDAQMYKQTGAGMAPFFSSSSVSSRARRLGGHQEEAPQESERARRFFQEEEGPGAVRGRGRDFVDCWSRARADARAQRNDVIQYIKKVRQWCRPSECD